MAADKVGEREAALAQLAAVDLSAIADPGLREAFGLLLNLVEELAAENRQLRAEVARLRDENARLKGGSGKPQVRPQAGKAPAADWSSERERREPKGWHKAGKKAELPVDRVEVVRLAPEAVPAGAEAKGYDEVVVQEVVFRRENILFRKEKFYAAASGETRTAALPAGYEGGFGPNLRALVLVMYFACLVSEPKIRELLGQVGVAISKGQLSNLLVKGKAGFHAEKAAVVDAGLASGGWQQTDHTATRVNGRNQHCQILTNPAYTAYTTTASKDRPSVLGVLRNGRPAAYLWNAEAAAYLEGTALSAGVRRQLAGLSEGERLDAAALETWLAEHIPKLGPQQRRWVEDGLGLAAYHAETGHPVVGLLLSDDAPPFAGVARAQALCWVHEGRLFRQLGPYLPGHRRLLDDFLKEFWGYYRQLRAYREAPTPAAAAQLAAEFDTLFATETGYLALDNRIALTRAKKDRLLRVLAHPELPLHNNAAELAARQRVRKRDISFGPRAEDGKQAWDTFATLLETGKKLGLSFYDLLRDRLTRADQIPPLADLVRRRAAELHLDDSRATP